MPLGEAAPQYQGPPLIQPPDPNVPEGELPRTAAADPAPLEPASRKPTPLETASPKNLPEPPTMDDRLEELVPPPGLEVASGEVSEIALNRELTGRRAVGGAAGKDSIVVVVEPRTADGRPVQAAGAISIVVLDLSKDGPEAHLPAGISQPRKRQNTTATRVKAAACTLNFAGRAIPRKQAACNCSCD